jgi:lipopolysaccharide transport system ATP-binding protein
MSKPIITVENLYKSYILRHQNIERYTSLRDVIANKAKSILNLHSTIHNLQSKEKFWALDDVSFEVNQGDRIGIIGRNGAGKSTLLKILSRIVTPTKGRITIEGRVASLLEVGTGFHPELTGRENIFLNGSILGMSKSEIKNKYDEIVAFSEVEKFLDTPVKRYSSGMYVRLAFAVAAHLDPDVLIVDEVLAVGDAEFQKKCLGKMQDVSTKQGRTVLFVSHNMGQISALCKDAILLDKGKVVMVDGASKVIQHYYTGSMQHTDSNLIFEDNVDKEIYIKSLSVVNEKEQLCNYFSHNEPICLKTEINVNQYLKDVLLGIHVYDSLDRRIFTVELPVSDLLKDKKNREITMIIPPEVLTPNNYKYTVGLHIPNVQLLDEQKGVCSFSIFDNGSPFYKYSNIDYGCVFVKCEWKY